MTGKQLRKKGRLEALKGQEDVKKSIFKFAASSA